MIPKRMFFFWDREYISWMRYMTIESFRKMNPDWEIVLCMGDSIPEWERKDNKRDFTAYKGENYFHKIKDLDVRIESIDYNNAFHGKIKTATPIHYSDLYRYYKLHTEGGFYADMDIIFFKPMDAILADMEMKGNMAIYHNKYVAIGFLGAEQGNRFFRDLIPHAVSSKYINRNVDKWEAFGEMLIYNFLSLDPKRQNLCNKIEEKYQELKVYNIPDSLVYNYDFRQIEKAFSEKSEGMFNAFPDTSIGYHWYGGHPAAMKYVHIMNEHNYMNHKTLFSDIYREISSV